MMEEENKDPKIIWENAFITSSNQKEYFREATWNDGEHDLSPHMNSDNKIEIKYAPDEKEDDCTTGENAPFATSGPHRTGAGEYVRHLASEITGGYGGSDIFL